MAWNAKAGRGSNMVALVGARPTGPKIKRTDLVTKVLEEGFVAQEQGNMDRALAAYRQVMGLDKDNVGAMTAAALIHTDMGEYDAAEWLLRRSIDVAPTCVAYNSLGMLMMERRQWDAAINCYRSSIALDPSNTTSWPNLLFCLDLHPWATPELRLRERRAFNELHCRALTEAAEPFLNDPDPDRILRVGYVSADFKQHSAAQGFIPLIMCSRKDHVRTFLYNVDQSPRNPEDNLPDWFKVLGDEWRDMNGVSDNVLADAVRADRIDILVDLSGYSSGGRALAFARKAAPIQISGFGYATGLGIDAMDYLIGDDTLTPVEHERQYHEKILRLPIFMGSEKAPPWPEIVAPPRSRNGYVTFGYLGRAVKISPQSLDVWAQIMAAVPDARILFKSGSYIDEPSKAMIRGPLTALGVEPYRIGFRGGTNRPDHLAAHGEIDISLDPFPHGGGVTTVDSLLMGVPTITLAGDYICGRTGASILTALGFRSAVARTTAEYVSHAVETASTAWTVEDREGLRRRLTGSILLNEAHYAAVVEDAYRDVWRKWCEGKVS